MPNSNGQVSQMPMPQGQPNGPMMQSMPMNPNAGSADEWQHACSDANTRPGNVS